MDWGDYLQSGLPSGAVEPNFPLSRRTTLRIGGPASWCVTVHTREHLVWLIRESIREGIPWFLLGGGSNVLFADRGFEGVVIVNQLDKLPEEGGQVIEAGAGAVLMDLIRFAEAHCLGGFEKMAGIPGSVGGAIVGNAGAYGRCIGELIESVDLITEGGEIERANPDVLEFDYRHSKLKDRHDVVLSARFRLVDAARENLTGTIEEVLAVRAGKHPPHDAATAGSFFKNLPPEEPGGKRVAAGLILDRAGAKGMRVGDAVVFQDHGNIVVNEGSATAREVLELTGKMKQLAYERTAIRLEEEVRRIGFSDEELNEFSPRQAVLL